MLVTYQNSLLPPACCEQRIAGKEANEKEGATYPDDWDPCAGCGPGDFLKKHQLPGSLAYVWGIWGLIEANIGAESTVFKILYEIHGREGFFIMLDLINIIKRSNDNVKLSEHKSRQAELESKMANLRKGRNR